MKLTAFILLAGSLYASATSLAQRVSFSGRDVPLKNVFRIIEKQTGYVIFYDESLLQGARNVTLDVRDEPLNSFIQLLLKDRPIHYSLEGKTIILSRKEAPAALAEPLAFLQNITIKGRIVNENDEPVAGLSIVVKGTRKGTTTGSDGSFTLENVEEDAVLVISGVSILTQEVKVAGRSELNIRVQINVKEEEVIIAYGTQKKREVTGSVAIISGESLKDLPPTINLEQALQGKAAGVFVLQESGQPGAATRVRVRGASSLLGSNQPLYIVDGVPVVAEGNIPDDGSAFNRGLLQEGLNSPLNNINPLDIASISILKDAAATAIYGSRAANGVVIITTQHGSSVGKPVYSLNGTISTEKAQTQNMLNADQFREIWTEAANNSTSTVAVVQQIKDGSYFGDANTDWEKEVSRSNPVTRNANFSVSGGTDKIRYFSSVSTMSQSGTFVNADFSRTSFLTNLDLNVSRYLKLGTSINLSSSSQLSPDDDLLTRIYSFRPDVPVYNADGSFYVSNNYSLENPVALSTASRENKTRLLVGSVFGELTFLRDFRLRSVLSLNYNTGKMKSFYPRETLTGGWGRTTGLGTGFGSQSSSELTTHLWENTISYNRRFNARHTLDGVAGASWQGNNNEFLSASGKGFPQDDILNSLSSATSDFTINSYKTQSGLISYFGRLNYTYNGRYIFTVSARTDGSSKFAEENKWAFFPTAAAAWRISDEKFLANSAVVDELKLRASIGMTGQQNFGPYQWRTLFGSSAYGGEPAVIQTQLGNSRLKWELTRQTNIGVDFSLFKGRLQGVIDYYEKHTQDLLFNAKMPGNTAYASVIGNLGNSLNKGIEFTFDGEIIKTRDFTWGLQLNVSRNTNKLTSLNSDYLDTIKGTITPPNSGAVLKVGSSFGLLYGRVADGIIQTREELDALNAGAPDGIYQTAGTAPGDIKFKDITGPNGVPDGEITTLDQTVIGNAVPDFMGGFTSRWEYKGFRLSTLFTFSVGNDVRWGTEATAINFASPGAGENKMDIVLNRWTPEHPTNQPRAVYGDPNQNNLISSFYVYDGSYLRLKNIFLSYSIPQQLLTKTRFLKRCEITASATNLLTFTKYPGPNPETSNLYNDDLSAGLDNSRFPISKVFTAGIRFGF